MNEHATPARFVVQRHDARTLHYDFRLEREGVFVSWAVPKGLPEEAGVQRLALRVEDHDLSFGDFEGEIPEGQYGAGTIEVWDRGVFDLLNWSEERIDVRIHGQRYSGRYVLLRFRRKGEREWLLSRTSE